MTTLHANHRLTTTVELVYNEQKGTVTFTR